MNKLLLAFVIIASPAVAQEFITDRTDTNRILMQAHRLKVKHAKRPIESALSRPLPDLLGELDDADPMVRLLAVQQLAPYVKANMIVRERLKSCLADSAVEIRALTIVTLGSVAMDDESVRLAIQDLFLKDDNDAIKLSGMEILWPRITTDGAIRARILGILKTPIRGIDDLFVVDQAVISVMNVSVISTDAEIRDAILRILAYDDSWFLSGGLISSTAGMALKPLCRTPDVRAALQTAAARNVNGAIETLAGCTEALSPTDQGF